MKAPKPPNRQPTHEMRLRDLPESLAWILCAGEPLLALAEHTAVHDPVARAACERLRSAHRRYYCGGAPGDIDASVAPRDLGIALASVLVEGAGTRNVTPMAVLLDALDEYRWMRTWSPPRDALAAYRLVVRALDAARQRVRMGRAS